MAEKLIVEVLNQNWVRKGATGRAIKARKTEELGQVGDADVEIAFGDPVIDSLPNPDDANPYEGRFRLWEDDDLAFAGVIDSQTIRLGTSDGVSTTFSGKGRGMELGFQNLGRVDYIGWHIKELFRELLRDNVAKKATLKSVSSESELYGAYQMVTGDPFKQNYWKSETNSGTHSAVFDLGSSTTVSAIRVMPQWWKDIDTNKFHWHEFNIATSPDNSTWTTRGTKGTNQPSTAKGHLYAVNDDIRYFRIQVTDSTDGYARIGQIMVYRDLATIGGDTTYTVPFVENDDSGNVDRLGSPTPERPIVPGAFQGDDVITRSAVTQLVSSGQKVRHTFRGVSNAVYFTQHNDGSGVADIYVDGNFRQQITVPNNKYWYKGYDTLVDFGVPLSDTQHTLEVRWVSGTLNVDYFNGLFQTSWRPIEDDDSSVGYTGNWSQVEKAGYYNFFSSMSQASGNQMTYSFIGDRVRILGSKGSGFGTYNIYLDGALVDSGTSAGTAADRQSLYDSGDIDYDSHTIRLVTTSAGKVFVDRIEGNFNHTLYMRARYEQNLKVLIRMSEIIDSYIRFNHDGTVDLVGAIGDPSGTALLEGTNEGGSMISANVENDYSETGSAVLAIVNVNGELPIKAFVIDREAVAEIGYKVIKLEQSDAADQFLLNRQALQYLREKRKPARSYTFSYDPDRLGDVQVGQTTRVYVPSANMEDVVHRIGRITTEYET